MAEIDIKMNTDLIRINQNSVYI